MENERNLFYATHSNNNSTGSPVACNNVKRVEFQTFTNYLDSEIPTHYKDYYVRYDECKTFVSFLAIADETFKSGIGSLDASIPPRICTLLEDTLQSLLAAHASDIDESVVRSLVPQVAFRDCISQELERVNQFTAIRYHKIERDIRQTFRTMGRLISLDKGRHEYKKELLLQNQTSISVSHNQDVIDNGRIPLHNNKPLPIVTQNTELPYKYHSNITQEQHSELTTLNNRENDPSIITEHGIKQKSYLSRNNSLSSLNKKSETTPLTRISSTDSNMSSSEMHSQSSSLVSSTILRDSESDDLPELSDEEFEIWFSREMFRIEVLLECQAAEIIHLDMFIRLNYKALVKLSNVFDKMTTSTTCPWITASLTRELFLNVDLNRLLIFMSVAWERWRFASARSITHDILGTSDKWVPPESFIRNTTKYWIRSDQVIRLKLSILRHMPYLIFGCTHADLETFIDPFCALQSPNDTQEKQHHSIQKIEEGQLVTSIYFDSPTAYSYRRRILRLEGAELIRFRWYGSNHGEHLKPIFVERKTHHESWSGQVSAKERFTLPQKWIFEYMKGRMDLNDYVAKEVGNDSKKLLDKKFKNILFLGHEIQTLIIEKELQPMVRTSYQRSAFQLSTSNAVRFSLDTNLCMVDEYTPDGHPELPWCRLGEEILGKDEVVRFPYAVLEVKLQASQPSWVSSILVDTDATMVYKFSKFQHGMAFLHRPLVMPHGIPHWIPDFERLGYGAGFEPPITTDWQHHQMTVQQNQMVPIIQSIQVDEHDKKMGSISQTYQQGLLSKSCSFLCQLTNKLRHLKNLVHIYSGSRNNTSSALSSSHLYNNSTPAYNKTIIKHFHLTQAEQNDLEIRLETLNWNKRSLQLNQSEAELTASIYKRSKNIRKIDPKSFFASERTFLHYIQKALYLGGLAIALVTLGNHHAQTIGLSLGIGSVIVIIYSYYVYFKRCNKLLRRYTKALSDDRISLGDTWGPVVLFFVVTITILGAVLLNLDTIHTKDFITFNQEFPNKFINQLIDCLLGSGPFISQTRH